MRATLILGIVLVSVFVLEIVLGAAGNERALAPLGALRTCGWSAADWWRILTFSFLHLTWVHLTVNLSGLVWLGGIVERRQVAQLFSVAAERWLSTKKAHLAPRSVVIERANLKHLNPFFGKMLICDIRGVDVARYQAARLQEGAAPKTVNLEVGTARAVLRKNRLWFAIQPDVRMLRAADDVGRAISGEEESALLAACQSSRSRSLYTSVVLALNTCMRYSELRLLKWAQVDFAGRTLTVGASKTEAGMGRIIPLNDRAFATLTSGRAFSRAASRTTMFFLRSETEPPEMASRSHTPTTATPRNQLAAGKKSGKPRRNAPEYRAAFTICATPGARGCSKVVFRFRLLRQSWDGAPALRFAWQSDTGT